LARFGLLAPASGVERGASGLFAPFSAFFPIAFPFLRLGFFNVRARFREIQFDGLVGLTHNYAGLSPGNLASLAHEGQTSNPKAAALQGLSKMRLLRRLGVAQAVLPPHERPKLTSLRALGFSGRDEDVIAAAARDGGVYLRLCSSASAMWAANAATVTPSSDSLDGLVHFTPANLQSMFHRAIEAPTTLRVLRAIFAGPPFVVHEPLPCGGGGYGPFSDEGAANHLRLQSPLGAANVFAWGRSTWAAATDPRPTRYPARQTRESAEAIARLHRLPPHATFFVQQDPDGIDAGAFHTDVLAVANGPVLLMHELAFLDADRILQDLFRVIGEELSVVRATSAELPPHHAVRSYAFNSQLVTVADGSMVLVAPEDAREDAPSRAFLERAAGMGGPIAAIHYVDVRQSMQNGGGPACLRLRVPLTDDEMTAIRANVIVDDALDQSLRAWIERHYRDRLGPDDLADPALALEGMRALDELTQLLSLGSIYDFQR
jgi:succinylarginine dihydrolase